MRWWLSRLSSRFGAKSSRKCKPKWLSGLKYVVHIFKYCSSRQWQKTAIVVVLYNTRLKKFRNVKIKENAWQPGTLLANNHIVLASCENSPIWRKIVILFLHFLTQIKFAKFSSPNVYMSLTPNQCFDILDNLLWCNINVWCSLRQKEIGCHQFRLHFVHNGSGS